MACTRAECPRSWTSRFSIGYVKSDGVIRVDMDCESWSRVLRRVGDTSDVMVGLRGAAGADEVFVDEAVVTFARFVRVVSTSLLCSSCRAVNLPASKLSYRAKIIKTN